MQAAAPYMEHQNGEHNFEFFGVDLIADEDGCCWLIEANRYVVVNIDYMQVLLITFV